MEQEPQKLGKYTLVRHIATGGMAEIWLAEQVGPGGFSKQMVIKRILEQHARDTHFTQMFLDEARLVAQLTHPNIGQIHELGAIDETYFIAMEYIPGMDMSDLIKHAQDQEAFIPINIVVRLLVDVLRALDYAHTFIGRDGQHAGIVHRDVTPHNVLISTSGVAKLVDFGVAKAKENRTKTETGAVKGKFAYMAPEQIEGLPPDPRMDVFGVGVTLYEMLTNTRPFGDDLGAIHAILSKPHQDPRELRPEIPQTIVNILDVALAKAPEERYQNAAAMAADLEEFARASGLYTSQSDVAVYVCDILGVPAPVTTSHSSGGPRARITEREESISGPQPALGEGSLTLPLAPSGPTTGEETSPDTNTAQTPPEPTALINTPEPIISPTPPAPASNKKLVVAFAGVIGALLIAALAVVALIVVPKKKPRPKTNPKVVKTTPKTDPKTTKTTPQVEKKEGLKLLSNPKGTLVFIRTSKPSRVYFKGKYVGDTPIQVPLARGFYELKFKALKGNAEATHTVKVDEKTPMLHRFSFKI